MLELFLILAITDQGEMEVEATALGQRGLAPAAVDRREVVVCQLEGPEMLGLEKVAGRSQPASALAFGLFYHHLK